MEMRKLLCVFFSFIFMVTYVACQDVEYTINEEIPVGYLIGNIPSNTSLQDLNSGDQLQFSILKEGNRHSDLFEINNAGDLKVRLKIDREALCPFLSTCELQIEIAARSSDSFFKNLKVKIIVKDVNDNAPKFPLPTRKLEIPESSTVGSIFTLPGPSDNDTNPDNSIQSVEIVPNTVPFGVTFTKNLDGTSVVSIIVQEKLDRETRNFYYVKLLARDGGNPPLSSSMNLQIQITDVNDNAPVFSHSVYNVTINESTSLGVVILQVTATDHDEGKNGDIFYRLSSHQADEINQYFSMDGITGDMVLKQQLTSGHIKVIIEASDQGLPSKISQAFVEVDIRDTINNPPSITVNILSGTSQARVSESVRIGYPIAHIKILDPDTGANSIVTCGIPTDGFTLTQLEDYEYKAVVAKPLDYESIKNYTVTISCKDSGTPKLTTTANFDVSVIDANDNSPIFIQRDILMNMAENNAVGDTIVQLAATDKDSGDNRKLTFSLSKESQVNFTVQTQLPDTAIVKAKIRFDREDMSNYVVTVFAVDGGNPARTATATVTVNILDINDERPEFGKQAYTFSISENLPLGTAVGNVSAFDRDTEEGGKFSLTLALFKPSDPLPFTVLQNGTIITTAVLDRESTSEYTFKTVATDHGTTPLSGMTQVTVVVSDMNDNDPSFVFPNEENYSVSVFIPSKAGSVVVKVQAIDEDSDNSAQIRYLARDMNSSGLFAIDNSTGEIYTTKDIDASMIGTYYQAVMISNMEPSSKSVSQKLKIIVSPRTDGAAVIQQNDQYIVIVIVLVCATLLIAAAILLALCYLRKRDRDRQLKYVYEQDNPSYGIQNPATEVDGVSASDKGSNGRDKMVKSQKKDDLDSSSSTVNGHIITGNMAATHGQPANRSYSTNPEPVVPDREHQRQNQLMSFRLHQALQRINSESGSHEHSKILAANAKVMEWRDAQRRTDDFHSTSSGEITTGDSGHGSDEDSHIIAERSASSQKIRLGIGAFKSRSQPSQAVPPRSKVSPIKGTKMPPGGRNVAVLYPSHVNISFKKDNALPGYNSYGPQSSPRSDTIDDGDDTTTSGSYSITVDDIKSELPDFDYVPVKDVYV